MAGRIASRAEWGLVKAEADQSKTCSLSWDRAREFDQRHFKNCDRRDSGGRPKITHVHQQLWITDGGNGVHLAIWWTSHCTGAYLPPFVWLQAQGRRADLPCSNSLLWEELGGTLSSSAGDEPGKGKDRGSEDRRWHRRQALVEFLLTAQWCPNGHVQQGDQCHTEGYQANIEGG